MRDTRKPTVNIDLTLERLTSRYERSGRPVDVSFRKLVSWLPNGERATHLMHPYPAKLLMHIPHFFLGADSLSSPGDVVLDPFCGTGTVLLEAEIAGRSAIGVDSNPLARLIARAKTTPLSVGRLRRSWKRLGEYEHASHEGSHPDVVNINHWFYPHVTRQLTCLNEGIRATRDHGIRDFLLTCFSACVRRVSLADPRVSVPVRLREDQYPAGHPLRAKTARRIRHLRRVNVRKTFDYVFEKNLRRMAALNRMVPDHSSVEVVGSDAKNLVYEFSRSGKLGRSTADNSVQLAITSPPYAGAQKYVRASSLSLGWLGLCRSGELRGLEAESIGREHYRKSEYTQLKQTKIAEADTLLEQLFAVYPLRAHIAANYLVEMRCALAEVYRVLEPAGHCVLVAANNRVCGRIFRTYDYLRSMLVQLGFEVVLELVDGILSRGLMTRRNKTASLITRERVIVVRKPE